ncbi:site-specific integrase [Odoribacter sp. OttesenSCG-928-L07]|nr:site-specific integrase [Odoribacter sp. OttesenSCG-928-L07]
MNASLEVICYKVRPLKNGEYPLMLRITKSRKRKYVSIGMSIDEKYWDFKKNKPKRNCPNKEKIENLIANKIGEYNNLIIDLTTEQKEFTPETLVSTIESKSKFETVDLFYKYLIDKMIKAGKLGNADVCQYSFDSLSRFTKNKLNISFQTIDVIWLKRYEEWLRNNDCKETTMSQLFRTLRSVFNKALEQGIVKQDSYPFNAYKISKFNTSTKKRAINKDELMKIMQVDLSKERFYINFSRDIFVFSYLSGGINFTDIANLTKENISNNRLEYKRQKTTKLISLPLLPNCLEIISKYADDKRKYLFPIFDENKHKTHKQRHDRIHKVLKNVNHNLKTISEILELKIPLTTYVARHTFATILKRSGVNIAIISESLGHSDLATTQIYLDSFQNSQIDEAMKNLL